MFTITANGNTVSAIEGLVATVSNYFTKLANAVTGLLSGLVITFVGYTSHKDALGNVIRDTSPKVLMGFFAVLPYACHCKISLWYNTYIL